MFVSQLPPCVFLIFVPYLRNYVIALHCFFQVMIC